MKKILLLLFLILLLSNCNNNNNNLKDKKVSTVVHKIDKLLIESNDKSLNDSIRFDKVFKANNLANSNILSDSLKGKILLQFVKLSYPLKTKDSFLVYYPKSIRFSSKIDDKRFIAQTHNYTAYFYLKNNNIDSAYYHFYRGSKYFKLLKNNFQSGKMLLNMAIIQKNKSDYAGSEEVSKEALEFLLRAKNKRYLASVYNNLGIVNDELKKINIAIKYHQKALKIRKKLKKDSILILESINNIAAAYKDNGDYKKAFLYFDSIKPYRKLLKENPIVKARVIDNFAHTRLLVGNLNNVLNDMEEALSLRVKENHLSGIMVSYLHLAEYYKFIGNSKKSFSYAIKAKNISLDYKNYRDVLKALRLLSINNNNFIEEYFSISDNLKKVEDSVADKFARIRFEADQKEKENKKAVFKIKKQQEIINNRNLVIVLLLGITILFFYLLYVIKKSAKYKQELYKEFNHRTRNNLVEIQRGILKAKKNNDVSLNELETTTETQLLLYSILEQNNHPTHIFLDDYLKTIINYHILTYKDYKVSSLFKMDSEKINSKKASIIGLIMNEFMINAYKHGFDNELKNEISVTCKKSKTNSLIKVNVSSKQWEPKFPKNNGDGLNLMKSLAKKIPAKMSITFTEGETVLEIRL